MILERFPDYWRKGYPYVDRLEVSNSPGRMEGALNGFRGGLFDAVLGVDPGCCRTSSAFPGRRSTSRRAGTRR
jgi:peptide/nickel transport system substrate-binding protein